MSNKLPLKIALVGCGRVAEKHLKAFNYLAKTNRKHGKRVELIAVVDPFPQARERILSGYKFKKNETAIRQNTNVVGKNNVGQHIKQFDFIEELFATNLNDNNRKPDIVAITTPSGQHYAQAKLALENDCHVFIENRLQCN